MSAAAALLSRLRSLGVEVIVDDGRLRVSAARGQLTPELKTAISEQKTGLLALLANNSNGRTDVSAEVTRVPRDGPLPLSFFQERLWVQSRFQPDSTAYNMLAAWPSAGPIEASRVVEAIDAIVHRHEILRSCFREDGGVPFVSLLPPDAVPVEVRDLTGESPETQQATILAENRIATHTPFDLRTEPPVRFTVFRVAEGRVVTMVSAHHIAMDAWSFAMLGREIVAAYGNKADDATPGALDYVDFAAWQRRTLDDRTLGAELDWWKKRLAGAPKTSTLPHEHLGSRVEAGDAMAFRLSRELSEGLRALVREERATVYMALLGACAILINWHTGQEDIVLGSPMGLRERPEFETIVGPFVSLIVLRLDLSGDPTFAELLARTRSTVLDAHEHRLVPFEKVVEHVNPERSMEHAPIFQIGVVQHNAGADSLTIASGGALFDLTWFVRESEGAFECGLEYRSDRYSAETIAAVATRLETILAHAVENRHLRMSEVARLTPSEECPAHGDQEGPQSGRHESSKTSPEGYFRRQLEGAPLLDLPTDRPRALRTPGARASVQIALPARALDALRALAQQEEATLTTVLLAAFELLLHRHTGQTDVTVGVPLDDTQSGAAAGARPFRLQINPEADFVALVRAVRGAMAEFRGRPEPVVELASALARARQVLQSPAPSVLFGFGSQRGTEPRDDRASGPESESDLSLSVTEGERPSCSAAYDGALFDGSSIRRFVDHYRSILEAVAAEPGLRVSRVPLMSVEERAELLATARDTCRTAPPTTPVICLFEQQARRTPDATAVIDGVTTLSYRALDAAASALAKRLQALGSKPGQRVAVSLERSASVVVALLAVLKTGAAYVPVDPHYPPERGGYVLDDAQPVVLIAENGIRDRMPVSAQISVVSLDARTFALERGAPPATSVVDPDSVAYVLYTSGSTGRPKGVEVPNRALTNFLVSMQHTPGLGPDDHLLSVTTISFDIAGLEIFLPLVTGACVEIVPRDLTMDGVRLAQLIETSGATVMQATPATWRMLIEAGWRGNARLKILCGGEAMPRELANHLLARAGSVWNMYGPTETTVWSTVHRVGREEGPVSIGGPIDNTPVYVLDPHGELLPFGVPGELFIGGAGVARGYLQRPELTASRFLSDPFAGGEARMYRTGDAARLRPDGTLDYYGRLDHQVKIRGYRIELGEIESVLREHPLVAGVVVVAREFLPGDVRLVAYYVPRGAGVTVRELRELCQRKLPKDVVPSAWVALTAIPLTPNGKTDSKALPPPSTTSLEGDVERVAPRDALEEQLLSIWESVLETKVASIRDQFFDIGGHSLLAIRLFARIEQATGVALPLASLVEGGTIEHLAASIRERQGAASEQTEPEKTLAYLVPIRAHGSLPPLFCVHGAGGNVLNFRDIARHLSPDRPFYGIQAAGVDGTTRPMHSIEEMAEEYLAELRVVQPRGPYHLSGYCGGGIVAYEIAQRLRAAGEEVALLVLIDLYRPGVIVLDSRRSRWSRTLRQENVAVLLSKARAKFTRDFHLTVRNLRIQYHLSRGNRIPFDLRDHWLNVCFLQALDRYRLRVYPGKLTVFRAREVSPLYDDPGPDLGWGSLALQGVEAHEVPGDHHSLTLEPNVQVLVAQLEACLRSAEAAPESSIAGRRRARAGGASA